MQFGLIERRPEFEAFAARAAARRAQAIEAKEAGG